MMDTGALLLGALICAAATALATLSAKPWRAGEPRLAGLPIVGLGIGFLISLFVVVPNKVAMFPPSESWLWLMWSIVPVLLMGIWEAWVGTRKILQGVLGVVVIIAALMVLGIGRVKDPTSWSWNPRGWTGEQIFEWIGLSAVAALIAAVSSVWVSRKAGARPVMVAWVVTSVALAPVIGLIANFTSLAIAGGMFAVGTITLLGLLILFPKFEPGVSVWLGLSILSATLISSATQPWYAQLSIAQGLALLLAPLGCWAALLADRTRWWPGAIVVALASVAVACWPIGTAIDEYIKYRAAGLVF